MLDSKLLTIRKNNNECKLFITGDYNDADYITKSTNFSLHKLKEALPYLSIMRMLFDTNFIAEGLSEAVDYYIDDNKELYYQELLKIKEDENNSTFSNKVKDLDKEKFKKYYEEALAQIKEKLFEYCYSYLPDCDGFRIHSIKEMYIDYLGSKYDIKQYKDLEAIVQLVERKATRIFN